MCVQIFCYYRTFDTSTIIDINEYLMKKNNIK